MITYYCRVVSDHGKEARFPFLDEQVVSFLNGLPCHHKVSRPCLQCLCVENGAMLYLLAYRNTVTLLGPCVDR